MAKEFTNSLEAQEALFLITTNPLEAKAKFEKYTKKYPQHYFAKVQYASCLTYLGEFELAEKIIDEVTKEYKKDTFFLKTQTYIQEMEQDIHAIKLRLLSFQKKYDEFLSYCKQHQKELDLKSLAAAIFYCNKQLNKIPLSQRETLPTYLLRQILVYKKRDFYQHIGPHLAEYYDNPQGNEKTVFVPGFPINRVINEIKKNIPSDKGLYLDYFTNAYIFKYDNCGFGDDGKIVDHIKVICLDDSKNILTVYPASNCQNLPCVDLNYISKENPEYDYVQKTRKQIISPGDLISIDDETYLVRKVVNDKELSLLKVVKKGSEEVKFMYQKEGFYVLKQAIVKDSSNAKILKKYGSSILQVFERAKKSKHTGPRIYHHKPGDVIVINGQSYLLVEKKDTHYILLDDNNDIVTVKKDNTYKILYSMNSMELDFAKTNADYDKKIHKR